MLVVRIELWPHGDSSRPQVLGVAEIANDGTGDLQVGNYDVRLFRWGVRRRLWKRGRVEGFLRLKYGPWDLLGIALSNLLGKRGARAQALPRQ